MKTMFGIINNLQDNLKKMNMKQIIPIITAIISIIFIFVGMSKYGFWDPEMGPLPGFFPVIIAVLMFVISIFTFIFSLNEIVPEWPIQNWYAVLGVASIFGATFLIGLIPSLILYLFLWLRWLEKCTWKTTIITLIVTMSIVIGCFVVWLGVPFPKGIIYEAIRK